MNTGLFSKVLGVVGASILVLVAGEDLYAQRTIILDRSSRGAAGGKVLIPRQKGGGPGSRFWLQVE